MTYFSNKLEHYIKLHRQKGQIDKLYNALLKEDPSEAVVAALYIMKKARAVPKLPTPKANKEDLLSFGCRQTGNALFRAGDYSSALRMYNLALGSAPKNSESMLFAYSNRSALFQKVKVYGAALKDIETCLAMKCPIQIETKLKLRREECLRSVSEEKLIKDNFESDFGRKFFNKSFERHPQIPCVSVSVDVDMKHTTPKIVAAKHIPVGTVVGIETPFASNLDTENFYCSCHYCHKFVFNLIPCDNCCETFFCSQTCKEACGKEFHKIECHIIELIKSAFPDHWCRIAFKAALKIKTMTKTWEELISCLENPTSDLSELYDVNNFRSVLHVKHEEDHFVYGQKYNYSIIAATMIYYLEKIPGFFPSNPDFKLETIQKFGGILMHLMSLQRSLTIIQSAALIYPKMDVSQEPEPNVGLFSFTSKLKHDCDPNLLVLGLNNKVALVAAKPIPPGTELTISYVGHWMDQDYHNQRAAQLVYIKPACQCSICLGKWNSEKCSVDGLETLTESQKAFCIDWMKQVMRAGPEPIFNQTCRGLELLQDKTKTKQYLAVYKQFRLMLCQWQYLATNNGYVLT